MAALVTRRPKKEHFPLTTLIQNIKVQSRVKPVSYFKSTAACYLSLSSSTPVFEKGYKTFIYWLWYRDI